MKQAILKATRALPNSDYPNSEYRIFVLYCHWLILRRKLRMDRTIAVSLGRYTKPSFVIIGAMKGGSTSLYSYITAHPRIKLALDKELHYFHLYFHRGRNWYLGNFPTRVTGGAITGEATPDYMFYPAAPQRMADMLPEAKIIAVLRNPVDRAYSHYAHVARYGLENLSFDDAVAREIDAINRYGLESLPFDDALFRKMDRLINGGKSQATGRTITDAGGGLQVAADIPSHQNYPYVTRGMYANYLRRWYSAYPREQILLLKSEDLYMDPATTVNQVFEFLGLDADEVPAANYPRMHPGTYRGEMNPETRNMLREFFRPHNEELRKFVDFDISDWDE